VIALATSLPVALLGAVVVGIGFSMLFPSLALMVVGEIAEDSHGAALGAFTAFFDVGVGLGAPLAGVTASLAGYPAVFVLAAIAALGTAVLAAMPRAPAPLACAAVR
jgi:predicted MFS family arabinose efflux permease